MIGEGMSGIDLCCCNGARMRCLVRFRGVAQMTDVDETEHEGKIQQGAFIARAA